MEAADPRGGSRPPGSCRCSFLRVLDQPTTPELHLVADGPSCPIGAVAHAHLLRTIDEPAENRPIIFVHVESLDGGTHPAGVPERAPEQPSAIAFVDVVEHDGGIVAAQLERRAQVLDRVAHDPLPGDAAREGDLAHAGCAARRAPSSLPPDRRTWDARGTTSFRVRHQQHVSGVWRRLRDHRYRRARRVRASTPAGSLVPRRDRRHDAERLAHHLMRFRRVPGTGSSFRFA